MLTERVVDWTQQWKQEGRQEGLDSERRLLLRLIRHRFGEAIAAYSTPALNRIEQLAVFEDSGEYLLSCADGEAWLALLARVKD